MVLNNAEALLKNSVLVGSGRVTTKSGGKTVTAQHNYFEAPVTLGGQTYTARFDVTVNKATGENIVTGIDVKKAPEARPASTPDSAPTGDADAVQNQYIEQMAQMQNSGTLDNKTATLDNDAGEGYNGSGELNATEGAGDGLNKLPKTTEESVRTKLDTYLLEPNHPVGGSKAKWFKEALGFTKDNSIDLGKQIVFDPNKAVQTASNVHGTKFSQIISVHGANGKVIDVEFIFIKNNDGVIRLVTSIPTKR